MSNKKHLIGGILTTVCGRELEGVKYTLDINSATCKSCLKQKHDKYPVIVRKNEQ